MDLLGLAAFVEVMRAEVVIEAPVFNIS